MKIRMVPHLSEVGKEESGIRRVIEAYFKYLPAFGAKMVKPGSENYDLKIGHAGIAPDADVSHLHGLYWSGDYDSAGWEFKANQSVVQSIRSARKITVPSKWVAETIQRDIRVDPVVIPHGITWDDWQHNEGNEGYILWNKNRAADVCSPEPMAKLARMFPTITFVSTFAPKLRPRNVKEIGLVAHATMKKIVQAAGVYLSTTKETFGIGTLEALASGVPVLGFAHGGNVDLIQHGINGYLATTGNYDDLADGLEYCIQNRETLGANARELAKEWTWEKACEKVYAVYQEAMFEPPATAAIIIPCWNYSDKVGRAIDSALRQSYELLEAVVVVDDGSDDGKELERVVADFHDPRLRLVRQERGGVSAARNRGIAEVRSQYITCLDADDSIDPRFLSACINALEGHPELGIAYTKLQWIKPDGSSGVSEWPGDFDFDQQLRRRNQIPTACVFRRAMWQRLGGYRSRYEGSGGAGAEDAEFWLRAGAYGWGAVKATDAPLFVYSWQSGRVSGDRNYQEADWLAWHPWTRDGQHPFASVATPERLSHPVRQYDEPIVSVVIPIGPGHETKVIDALDSLEAQTLRRWEVNAVWDAGVEIPQSLKDAYPYVRWFPSAGKLGAGHSRNLGASKARAPFLMFLDADDWLYPEALEEMVNAWGQEEAIVYSDYVGKATISNPDELNPKLRSKLYYRDPITGHSVIGYKAADYDPNRAQAQPEDNPYIWTNVTCLIPRSWHQEVGGFDESLRTWEDVDYHWRMARAGKCYHHLEKELLVYRFDTGNRRELGLQEHSTVVEYLRRKYEEIEVVACGCAGGTKARSPMPPAKMMVGGNGSAVKDTSMADDDFVLIKYMHPNRGTHVVVGGATKTKYGYRSGGGAEQFLVHKADVANQPQYFQQMQTIVPPAPKLPPPAPPQPIAEDPFRPVAVQGSAVQEVQRIIPRAKAKFDLQKLPGITADIHRQLKEAGIEGPEDLINLGIEGLTEYRGIGEAKAERIIGAVKQIMKMAEAEA